MLQPQEKDNSDANTVQTITGNLPTVSPKQNSVLSWLKAIALSFTFIVMGITVILIGTNLVHLELLINLRAHDVSVIYFGYALGALLCAAIYNRLNPEFGFSLFHVTAGVITASVIFSHNYKMFLGLLFFQQACLSYIDAANQSYAVRLWNHHKFKKPLLQFQFVLWSFGGIVGPLILRTFLCELNTFTGNKSSSQQSLFNSSISFSHEFSNETFCIDGSLETVKYGFITMASLHFLAGALFVPIVIANLYYRKKSYRSVSYPKGDTILPLQPKLEKMITSPLSSPNSGLVKCLVEKFLALFILVLIFLFTFLNAFVEAIPVTFIVSFAIKHLHWAVAKSNLILSLYFGAHMASRIVFVFISQYAKPLTILMCVMLCTSAAFLLLLTVNIWNEVIWMTMTLHGLAIGTFFPTTVIWISEKIQITGLISGVLVSGTGFGIITALYLVGMMMSVYGQMYFVYIVAAMSIVKVFVFIFAALLLRRMKRGINE